MSDNSSNISSESETQPTQVSAPPPAVAPPRSAALSTSDFDLPAISPAPLLNSSDEPLPRGSRARGKIRQQEAEESAQPIPFVTYTMLAIIVGVYAAMSAAGHGNVNEVARVFGDKENDLIRAGQIWRFVTPIFLHGSIPHLFVNSLSLVWLGAQVEKLYGWRKYLILYMFAGIAGNVLSFLLSPGPSLGASGALFGLIGAGIVFPLRFRSLVPEEARTEILRQLLTVAAINLFIGFSPGSNVDNMAHIGGMFGGGFAALFLIPDVLEYRETQRHREAALSFAVALTLLVIVWAAFAQWRWAAQEAGQTLQAYGPDGSASWWSIGIPGSWSRQKHTWTSPNGFTVSVIDPATDSPVLVKQWEEIDQVKGKQLSRLLIDGKPAIHAVYALPGSGRVADIYLVEAYRHVIIARLDAINTAYRQAQKDWIRIIGSIRIIGPPTTFPTADKAAP